MRLLFDENISWRIVKKTEPFFEACKHVNEIGKSNPVSDTEIWDYALKEQYIIVTNDEDFENLITLNGFPPKVILLKTGNQSTTFLADKLIQLQVNISEFASNKEHGLLEIF